MDWRTTLTEVLDLSLPVTAAIAAQPNITLETAWDHPAIKLVRDRLMNFIGQPNSINELIEASQKLRELHAELLLKPKLTGNELIQLGVLSSTAYVLSSQALAQATSDQAVFSHIIGAVAPWLKRAADVAILTYKTITGSRDIDFPMEAPGATADDGAMLSNLISAHRTLSELLRQRLQRD